MAKSESQGLQIAVIIFAFLTITLSITTFYFFNEYSKARQLTAAAQGEARTALAGQRTAVDEIRELKTLVGVDPETSLDDVKQVFADDMRKYAASYPQDKQFYRHALEMQQAAIIQQHQALLAEQVKLAEMTKKFDALEAGNQGRLGQVKAEFDRKANDFATTAGGFQETERQLVSQKDDLVRQIAEKQAELDEINRKLADANQDYQKKVSKLESDVHDLRNEVNQLSNPTPEIPDGEIRWVNQRNRTVWINRGSADYLKPLVKFSVFASNGNGVAQGDSKAAIEVIKVLGENLAEARILEDDLANPILPGDLIYTPIWHAGRSEHFAFAGVMDIDKDGQPDEEIIRDLVRMNNGVIDAWLGADGAVTGELTPQTRYLIVGEPPKGRIEDYSDLRANASKMGIPVLALEKFIDHVGYVPNSRFVEYGAQSQPADFMDNQRDKRFSNPPPKSGTFRPRRPPAAAINNGSAY